MYYLAGLDRNRARVRVTATNEMMQSIQEWSSLIESTILIAELFEHLASASEEL